MHDKSSPPSASAWFTFKAVATAAKDSSVSRLSKALGASQPEQVQACFTHVLRTGCCALLKGRTLAAWCLPKPESCRLAMKAIVLQGRFADTDHQIHACTECTECVPYRRLQHCADCINNCMRCVFTSHAISIMCPSTSPALLGLRQFAMGLPHHLQPSYNVNMAYLTRYASHQTTCYYSGPWCTCQAVIIIEEETPHTLI